MIQYLKKDKKALSVTLMMLLINCATKNTEFIMIIAILTLNKNKKVREFLYLNIFLYFRKSRKRLRIINET